MTIRHEIQTCKGCGERSIKFLENTERWHSHPLFWRWIPLSLGLVFWYVQYIHFGILFHFWISGATAGMATLGTALDFYSTHTLSQTKQQFDQVQAELPLEERNPYLPKYPTLRDQIASVPGLLNLLVVALSFLATPVGIIVGLSHLACAFSNWQYRRKAVSTLQKHLKLA
jgi:hypothetical protein